MHLNRPTIVTPLVVFFTAILGIYFATSEEPTSKMVYSIFVSLLASCVFYVGTVTIPEIQRRKRIRAGLKKQYHWFKKLCVDLFLIASDSQEYDNRENLLDPGEFRRYFEILANDSQTRWDLVATAIDEGDYIFEELVNQFEFLIHEVNCARSRVEIYDDDVEDFFSRMVQTVHRIKLTKPNTDDFKFVGRTLWAIFTRWDHTEGQRQDDIIETMIERI